MFEWYINNVPAYIRFLLFLFLLVVIVMALRKRKIRQIRMLKPGTRLLMKDGREGTLNAHVDE